MTKAKMAGRNNVRPLQKTWHDLHIPTWRFIQSKFDTTTEVDMHLHIV